MIKRGGFHPPRYFHEPIQCAPDDVVRVVYAGERYNVVIVEPAQGADCWKVRRLSDGKTETVHGGFMEHIGEAERL